MTPPCKHRSLLQLPLFSRSAPLSLGTHTTDVLSFFLGLFLIVLPPFDAARRESAQVRARRGGEREGRGGRRTRRERGGEGKEGWAASVRAEGGTARGGARVVRRLASSPRLPSAFRRPRSDRVGVARRQDMVQREKRDETKAFAETRNEGRGGKEREGGGGIEVCRQALLVKEWLSVRPSRFVKGRGRGRGRGREWSGGEVNSIAVQSRKLDRSFWSLLISIVSFSIVCCRS